MAELFEKLMDIAFGVAAMTKDKAEAVVGELVKSGQLTREAGDRVVEELVQKGHEARGEAMKSLEARVQAILERMNLPTRKELDDLRRRLDALEHGGPST